MSHSLYWPDLLIRYCRIIISRKMIISQMINSTINITQVKYWMTIYDPNSLCYGGYGYEFIPLLNISGISDYLCAHHVLLAHAKVYHLYDREFRRSQNGEIKLCSLLTISNYANNSVLHSESIVSPNHNSVEKISNRTKFSFESHLRQVSSIVTTINAELSVLRKQCDWISFPAVNISRCYDRNNISCTYFTHLSQLCFSSCG